MNFLNEIRFGLRVLLKNWSFTAVAVITLAVCIAANAAIFSMADAAFRPFPFKDLDQVVVLSETIPQVSAERYGVTSGNFFDWKDRNHVLGQMEAYKSWDATVTGSGDPEHVQAYLVSPGFFSLLGVQPFEGRVFSGERDENERDQIVVSYKFWKQRLGSDSNLLGKLLTLNGLGYTVIGVMPKEFEYPMYAEIWAPWVVAPVERNERAKHEWSVIARLKTGFTIAEARAEMSSIGQRLAHDYPLSNSGRGIDVMLLREAADPYARRFMTVLMSAVAFLLLLACANVANLQLARGAMRRKEMALRVAIGAGRGRIALQLFTEGFLLSLLAAVLGLPLAVAALAVIKANIPQLVARNAPFLMHTHLDIRMVTFVLAAVVLTAIASTLPVTVQASPKRLAETLKEAGRGFLGPGRSRMRSVLVISEIGFAIVLLIGAGLMVNGFRHLASTKPGIDPSHVLTFAVGLRESQYSERYQVANFYKETLGRLRAIPEMQSVGVISELPALGDTRSSPLVIEGQTVNIPEPERPLLTEVRVTSEDYFRTMAIPIREGRIFTSQDSADALPVAVVSMSAARRFWPGQDAIGRRFKLVSSDIRTPWVTVVGMVGDVEYFFLDTEVRPTVYLPYLQQPIRALNFVIR